MFGISDVLESKQLGLSIFDHFFTSFIQSAHPTLTKPLRNQQTLSSLPICSQFESNLMPKKRTNSAHLQFIFCLA